MINIDLNKEQINILCLGAHCDDIEIGCGASILKLIDKYAKNVRIKWMVFTSDDIRKNEAKHSAELFLEGVHEKDIDILNYKDGFLPRDWNHIKLYFEKIKGDFKPDIIFTHYRHDLHQDHRVINELTWNTFRNHFILEYEILKYDGDIGNPNFYISLSNTIVEKKCNIISESFVSQKNKKWFTSDAFKSIMRVRGVETNQEELYSEGFYARKILF
jgi:LmbE family N-acetylglucosaminyl deacetylase